MNNHTDHENDDCPTCYGKASSCGKLPVCEACIYLDSCRWYIANPDPEPNGQRSSKGHHVSFEAVQFSEEVANIPDETNDPNDEELIPDPDITFTYREIVNLLEFLFRGVDDYSLSIVLCAMREDCHSAAEIARAFNVSREAIHRKLLDCCALHPELGFLLRSVLYRCANLSKPSLRHTIAGRRQPAEKNKQPQPPQQMEFTF